MADLSTDRLSTEPYFTSIELNIFGHFLIKQHGKEMETHVIIFTSCLSSRPVHLEVVYTMETDSFI